MQNPPTSSHPAKLPTRTKISVAEKKQMVKGGRWREGGRKQRGKMCDLQTAGPNRCSLPRGHLATCFLPSLLLLPIFSYHFFFRQGPWRCVWSVTFEDKNLIPKVWPPGCIYDGQWTHIASLRCLEILAIFHFPLSVEQNYSACTAFIIIIVIYYNRHHVLIFYKKGAILTTQWPSKVRW